MLKKGNKLYSILSGTCPKCHQESMYIEKNPYKIMDTLKINDNCSKCGFKYQIEPSFFIGAMYVSYAVGVAFSVVAFVISFLILKLGKHAVLISIIITLVAFAPITMRVSRNIWINIFVNYDKTKVKN
ncbi:DUF983 domain-containing protein [Olleya sp. AH-315-F22]|nr:DUF983 domain-containing protein [Olleya sp. AH-315-F22]